MSRFLLLFADVIMQAAREPEIEDLGNCLKSMGAKIDGLGSNKIYVQGGLKLLKMIVFIAFIQV